MQYYVQHGAGLGGLVADALKTDLIGVRVTFSDESCIIFESRSKAPVIAGLPYVKNAFQVLGGVARGSVAGSTEQLVKHIRKRTILRGQQRGVAFRTMTNIDGQLVGLPRETRARLEAVIAEQTGGRVNARGGSGVEYWIVGRRDLESMLFCLRLAGATKKSGPRGGLSSDLSSLLVKSSKPARNDVFLDPFGGSGSIVAARVNSPYLSATYSDIRLSCLRRELHPVLSASHDVRMLDEDALELPSVANGSITSIVTDPPWGEHEDLGIPYGEFAEKMMRNFDRVLDQRSGRLTLLVSRRRASIVAPLWKVFDLRIDSSPEILVNGHPATVLIGARTAS